MESPVDCSAILATIREGGHLTEPQVFSMMYSLREILYRECNVLELRAPITVCGDIHGQLWDLFQIFDVAGEISDDNSVTYLFMGDYVDRGYYSLETFAYLVALKLKHPNRIFLLRGNHESRQVNHMYGFYNDCIQLYGHVGVWSLCNDIFDLLPIAAVIDGGVFCVHGGLSKAVDLVEQLDLLSRRIELPTEGPLCDLCWSDPADIDNWEMNSRGAGWIFGRAPVEKFLRLNGLKMIARSHQMAMEGYEWYFDKKLITVWSAPNYMYRAGNKATVMKLDENLNPELVGFDAHPDSMTKKPDDIVLGYFA